MKGIKIRTEGGKYRISFDGEFVVIEDDVKIEKKTYKKQGSKGNKESRYETYFREDGKKRWRLKEKYKGTKGSSSRSGAASLAMKESWKRRKAEKMEEENEKKYEGLTNLNQNLDE